MRKTSDSSIELLIPKNLTKFETTKKLRIKAFVYAIAVTAEPKK